MGILDIAIGPSFAAVSFTTFMSGIVSVQVYIYFRHFPKDPPSLKILIGSIWPALTTDQHLAGMYNMLVTNFGQISQLPMVPLPWKLSLLVADHIDHISQGILVYRLYKFSKHIWIALPLWGLTVYCYVITILIFARTLRLPDIRAAHGPGGEFLFNSLFVCNAVLDVTTAALLCYYFRIKSRASIQRLKHVMNSLVLYTIQSGIFTSSVALGALITFNVMKDNFVWLAFYLSIPGFFANALIASYNNRLYLEEKAGMSKRSTDVELSAASDVGFVRSQQSPRNPDETGSPIQFKSEVSAIGGMIHSIPIEPVQKESWPYPNYFVHGSQFSSSPRSHPYTMKYSRRVVPSPRTRSFDTIRSDKDFTFESR